MITKLISLSNFQPLDLLGKIVVMVRDRVYDRHKLFNRDVIMSILTQSFRRFSMTLVLLLACILNSQALMSDDTAEQEAKFLEEFVADFKLYKGILDLYLDTETGDMYMAVDASQLDQEILYFAVVQNGVLEADLYRGAPLAQDVIEIRKQYNRIEFVKKNTNYVIDPDSELANGGYANITDSVLATSDITATSEDGKRFLISADSLFKTEALARITYNLDPDTPPHQQFNIGQLSEDKSKYTHIGVYPENLNVRTDYIYENTRPYQYGSERIADPRATTVTVQHSFVTMPDNDFVPRLDDQRVGYFLARSADLNSYEFLNYRDYINRFHLVKKNPDAALSEPVEPIVWWIENTTPVQYREIMTKGILAWNSSFEKAGFKNAIVVKQQPDDATWNAEDIRYNVVRWSNTPGAGFAFGPNFVNPRTGQVLGGDVMFEHTFVDIGYTIDVLGNPDAFFEKYSAAKANKREGSARSTDKFCSKGHEMIEMAGFANVALTAMNASVSEKRRVIEEMLYELMLHEVGHVLGLAHNMKGSNYRSQSELFDIDKTNGIATSSIMDYTALLIAKPGEQQGNFYSTKPGPYDDWAIQFGYDPNIEGDARDALLARSTERELMFGNDADDMRSPGGGIDPRVNIWDMSDDSIQYGKYQFELVEELAPILKDKLQEEGESWAKLRYGTQTLIGYKARPARVLASYIGGVEVTRFVQGQPSDSPPYMPVDKETQQRALQVLSEHVFAPDAFELPQELIQHSAVQRRGFDYYGKTEDPKLHTLGLGVQKTVLDRVLDPTAMLRLTDTLLYGNAYSVNQMISELTDAIFKADLKSSVNTHRQLLQNEYVARLIDIMKHDEHDSISKAAAFNQLERVKNWMSKSRTKDASTKAHRQYLEYVITDAFKES